MDSVNIKNELIKLLINRKRPNEISDELNLKLSTVYYWLRKFGYTKETKNLFQEIFLLIEKELYDEAYKLCDEENIKNTFLASVIKNTIIRMNNVKKESASELDLETIKSLIKQKRYDEALNICNEKQYLYDSSVQSNRVKILNILERFDEALEICNCEVFEDNVRLQSQKVSILLKMYDLGLLKSLEEPLAICNREVFEDNEFLQSQKVAILLKMFNLGFLKRLEEPLAICNREVFEDNEFFQSQKVSILLKMYDLGLLKRLEEPLAICNREVFEDNEFLQSQKVSILLKMYDLGLLESLEEPLAICNREVFENVESLQKQKKEILQKMKDLNSSKYSELYIELSDPSYLQDLFTRIYADCLTIEDIENSDLVLFEKLVLSILYYEKNNKETGLKQIKKYLENDFLSEDQLAQVKRLLERLKKSKTIVDYGVYASLLKTEVDMVLYEKILKEKTKVIEEISMKPMSVVKKENNNTKPIKKASCNLKVVSEEVKVIPHEIKKKKIEKEKQKKKKVSISLKDAFPKEYQEIVGYLYVKANVEKNFKNVIRALDFVLFLGECSIDASYIKKESNQEIKYYDVFLKIIEKCYEVKGNERVRKDWK